MFGFAKELRGLKKFKKKNNLKFDVSIIVIIRLR